jgi:HK97 family phage portal protein
VISEDLASTSHEIFQSMPDGSMRAASEHRLWPILHDEPNPNMSAMLFWGCLLASCLGWGNGYAWIKRDRAARVISLVPLQSGKTAPVKIDGQLKYGTTQTDTGAVAYIEPENMLHLIGLTFDGILGISPIQTCKNAFGLALAAEKYGAQFFGNGARATGVLTYPGALEAEAYENLRKSVRERLSGENALMPYILEEGLKWEQTSVNPNEAQFLATRQFQKVEIASLYRVPMHLLQDLQRATNNNIEHQSLDYIRYCLRPWAVRVEQETKRKLLSGPFSMEHNLNDMQRGDFASQTAGFTALRNIGVYSANDILRAMRQNPIAVDEGGDVRTVQGAMIPLSSLLSKEGPTSEDDTTDSDAGAAQPFDSGRRDYRIAASILPAYQSLVLDVVGRVAGRRVDVAFARRAIRPIALSMLQAMVNLRFGYSELTKADLALIDGQADAIAADSASWDPKESAGIAKRVTEQMHEALARGFS